MTSSPTVKSVTATLRHQFTPNVQAFPDAGASSNASESRVSVLSNAMTVAANAPNNPFAQSVIVAFPSNGADANFTTRDTNLRAVAGVVVALSGNWTSGADYTWSRSSSRYNQGIGIDSAGLSAAVSNGSLDVLRDTQAFPVNLAPYTNAPAGYSSPGASTLKDAVLRASGPTLKLPAGPAILSAALERRDENIGSGLEPPFVFPSTSQSVDSAYVEFRIPLASAQRNWPGVRELEVQVAGCYDRYDIDGANLLLTTSTTPVARAKSTVSSENPTIALRYVPIEDVALRASFGTGFLPPDVTQLVSSNSTGGAIVDPRRGNTQTILPLGAVAPGGNPSLQPEKSTSWSAGLVLTPHQAPGLRFSVDYVHIKKTDDIAAPGNQVLVDNETIFAGRVTRGPKLPGDPADWAGPVIALDDTLANFASAELSAYDFALDYSAPPTPFGSFNFYTVTTWEPHYRTQFLPSSPVIENVGVTTRNPLHVKANAGLTWKLLHWTAGWNTRYFDSYFVANPLAASSVPIFLDQGSKRVPSQIYHDAFVSYSLTPTGAIGHVVSTIEVTLGVKNVFNTKPPFDASYNLYYSTYGDPCPSGAVRGSVSVPGLAQGT